MNEEIAKQIGEKLAWKKHVDPTTLVSTNLQHSCHVGMLAQNNPENVALIALQMLVTPWCQTREATAVQGLCRLADQPDAAQIIQGNTLHSIVQAALENPELRGACLLKLPWPSWPSCHGPHGQAAMALMAKLAANPACLSFQITNKRSNCRYRGVAQAFHMDCSCPRSYYMALIRTKLQDIIRAPQWWWRVCTRTWNDPNALLNARSTNDFSTCCG